jgi:large subunit ribosomal protein L4e
MTTRPLVSVYNPDNGNLSEAKVALPGVFAAPIRLDIVQFVHSNLAKNRRQAYAVNNKAGMKHSAESWGPGRAVARIPRVGGSGTHRSGQGAFANMCRKGRMFAPTHTWRRWNRKVNLKQKRHAAASALAASALFPLVAARGHRVDGIPQLPLIVEDRLESYEKTKDAVQFLKRVGAYADVKRVISGKALRPGLGKLRNRRYRNKRGPLVVYANENVKLTQAFRNIPGVDTANVHRLNLLDLAPGGHVGRFIIWTAGAVKALDNIFGSARQDAVEKGGYHLNRPVLTNADIARIINSNEVQSAVRPAKESNVLHEVQKKNPRNNRHALARLNPAAGLAHAAEKKANEERRKARQEHLKAKRGFSKSMTPEQRAEYKKLKKVSRQRFGVISRNINDRAAADSKDDDDYRAFMRGVEGTAAQVDEKN